MSLNYLDVINNQRKRFHFSDSYLIDHHQFEDFFAAQAFVEQFEQAAFEIGIISRWIDKDKLEDVPFLHFLEERDLVAYGLIHDQVYVIDLPEVVIQSAVGENSTLEPAPPPPLPARQQASGKAGANGSNSINSDGNNFNTDGAATGGDPVAMFNGEELLTCHDVTIPGTELVWERRYRSSRCADSRDMGRGWRHGFDYRLAPEYNEKEVLTHWLFTDNQGNTMRFDAVEAGAISYQRRAGASLHHHVAGHWLVNLRDGRQLKFAHIHQTWCCIQLRFPHAVQLDFKYSISAKLIAILHSGVEQLWCKYNRQGQLIALLRPAERLDRALTLAQYQYDNDDHLIQASNANAETEHYRYRDDHLLERRQRGSGLNHYFVWDGEGETAKCVRQHSDDGYYDYRFEFSGLSSNYRDALDHQWRFVHDQEGNLTQLITPEENIWYYEYNAYQQKVMQKDPCGHQTLYLYNRHGQLTTEVHPENHVYQYAYNELGQCVAMTNPAHQTWRNHYNSLGLLTHSTAPDGRITYYQYDPQGRVKAIRYPNGERKQWWRNAQGQPLAFQHNGVLQRYHYNARGQRDAIAYADGSVAQLHHNDAGQLVRYTLRHDAMGEVTRCHQYQYDKAGRINGYTLNGERGCQLTWGEFAQPETIIRPDDAHLHLSYDKSRQLTAIERSDGHGFAFRWTAEGRIAEYKDGQGSFTAYDYDPCGRTTLVTQAQQQLRLQYNPNGRVTQVRATNANAFCDLHFRYDAAGRLSSAINAQQTVVINYHSNGSLNNVWQHGQHIQYGYDGRGLRDSVSFPDGTQCQMRYNKIGQLIAIELNDEQRVNLGYDDIGRIAQISSTHHQATHNNEQRIYDGLSRLVAQQWSQQSRNYAYNTQHRIAKIEDSLLGATDYHYDAMGQIIKELGNDGEISYPFNSFGNRTDAEYRGDRLIRNSESIYSYDEHGNQVYFGANGEQGLTQGEQHRQYNALNQLMSINVNGVLTEYEYDALGRRSRKCSEHGVTEYFWEGNHLIGEMSRGVYRWYFYLPGTFTPLMLIENNQIYLYRCDQVGAPIALFDTQGHLVWRARYSTWGKVFIDCEKIKNPLRFQGQYCDEESGLHYNLTRYYDPVAGRFIQPDPIGVMGGVNVYQYAPNPIQWVDPLGMSCQRENSTNIGPGGNGGGFDADSPQNVERAALGNELGDNWLDNACWFPDLPEPDFSKANLPEPQHKVVVEIAGTPAPHSEHLILQATDAQPEQVAWPVADDNATHRSLNSFTGLENEPKDLYLSIPFADHGEPVNLLLAEGLAPVDESAEKDEWETIMVPVRLLAYLDGSKDKRKVADLRGGYIYVFWKNVLWRELAVDKFGRYRDVNLDYYREQGDLNPTRRSSDRAEPPLLDHLERPVLREAKGFGQEQFWVPFKIKGEEQSGGKGIRVMFSPDQLPMTRIDALHDDHAQLHNKTTPLDEIGQYGGAHCFTQGENIQTAKANVLPAANGDEMPWLSDDEDILTRIDNSNTVYGFVGAQNGGLRIKVDVGPSVVWDEDQPSNMLIMLVDSESDWRKATYLSRSRPESLYVNGQITGIPEEGVFSLYLINGNSFTDRQLVFADKSYAEIMAPPPEPAPEGETVSADIVPLEVIEQHVKEQEEKVNRLLEGWNAW
ncbi:RHS repeat-associated core domain-containing protein [Thaumasiovibrio sp. DFM-14]|uniref:RHS repeat-associated core domain-containing protein n=1 Tax=Thaumasiovibrio sp. DFM-14 TaxID=3384792 RepID=UPI00399FBC9D